MKVARQSHGLASEARSTPLALSPISQKVVPFSANVHSISGTEIGEQQTPILSAFKIPHHEFLLEKRSKIRSDFGQKKQRGITAA
jgi:hypothetical protein